MTQPSFIPLPAAVMAAAEAWLRALNVKKLVLPVRSSNAPVLGFYAAQECEDGNCALMQKWLDPERDRLYREGGM